MAAGLAGRACLSDADAALSALSDVWLVRNAAACAADASRTACDARVRRRRALGGALNLGCYYTAQAALTLSAFSGLYA